MKMLRSRLTYANVMSSIAVFLVLGGATALAAGLAKNSVGSKQLKKNAVTSAKIKKNAVTTSKIKNGAVSGAKINLGSLGTVPSASHAGSADSAANATNAGNANTVGGQSVTKLFKTLLPGESNVQVAVVAGFTFAASCDEEGVDVTLTAPSGVPSVLSAQGNGTPVGSYFEYDSGEASEQDRIRLDYTSGADPRGNDYGQASFSGALGGGTVISGELGYDYETFGGENPKRCIVFGEVTSG